MEDKNWMLFFEKYLSEMGTDALGQIVMAVHFKPKYKVEMCNVEEADMNPATRLLYKMICDYNEGKWPPVLSGSLNVTGTSEKDVSRNPHEDTCSKSTDGSIIK